VLLLAAPAAAADLPGRYEGPNLFSSAPVATWTGFYVGAQVGYAWGSDQTHIDVPGFPFTFIGPDLEASGAVGGVHAGFNYQYGQAVFGLEGDLELANIDGNVDLKGSGSFPGYNITSSANINVQGSIRGRLGFALLDRMMVYGTGGLAFANLENGYSAALPPGNVFGTAGGLSRVSFEDIRWGWTLGAGVEYALTSNITARLEYRYTNFSSYKNETGFLGGDSFSEQDPDFHTIRIGASYRF
jgi:outer membrane immunogenic protein